jgi:hypothetical protein
MQEFATSLFSPHGKIQQNGSHWPSQKKLPLQALNLLRPCSALTTAGLSAPVGGLRDLTAKGQGALEITGVTGHAYDSKVTYKMGSASPHPNHTWPAAGFVAGLCQNSDREQGGVPGFHGPNRSLMVQPLCSRQEAPNLGGMPWVVTQNRQWTGEAENRKVT